MIEPLYFQHFKVYLNFISFSYSIKFPTVPQHKMQHAEKGKKETKKKTVLKLKSFQISPHKLKRTQDPQRKVALTN